LLQKGKEERDIRSGLEKGIILGKVNAKSELHVLTTFSGGAIF